jgi:phosphodiesterase/alkaline phosphatase D-like protein
MRKILATLLMTFALITWSAAQTEQTQSTDANKSSSATGIEKGPTVDASDHSATIRWETDDRAATVVKYGTDKNNLNKEARHSGGSRDHNVTLAELQPGTKYFYQIQKANGEVRASGEFTTKGAGESASSGSSQSGSSSGSQGSSKEERVVITEGPTVQPGADGTAKIVWKTDDIAATDVKYGTDQNNLQQRAFKPGGSRNHEADLKNLQAGQTYYFQVLRRDGGVRTTGQFQYQPQAAATTPVVGQQPSGQASAVQISAGPWLDTVADNRAVITWKTSFPSSSVVRHGTDRNALNQMVTGNWGSDHAVTIEGLNPNATYFFQVESTQAPGQTAAKSEIGAFQTVAPGAQAKKNPPISR